MSSHLNSQPQYNLRALLGIVAALSIVMGLMRVDFCVGASLIFIYVIVVVLLPLDARVKRALVYGPVAGIAVSALVFITFEIWYRQPGWLLRPHPYGDLVEVIRSSVIPVGTFLGGCFGLWWASRAAPNGSTGSSSVL